MMTSGISYYTCHLANALSERQEVQVILMRRLLPRFFYPGKDRVGSTVHSIAYDPAVKVMDGVDWFWGLSIVRAVRFLRRFRPDVIHFQWWSGTVLHSYLLLAVVARMTGAKVVIEFHETTSDTAEARIPVVRNCVPVVLRRFLQMSSAFVVHSEHDRAQVLAGYRLPSAKVTVIPHGPYNHTRRLATTSGASAQNKHRRRTDHPDAPFNILFFGTIRPYKGLEHVIEAFDSLDDDQVQRFRLTVVGETWENWTKPSEMIESSRFRSRITFVNSYVTDEEAHRYFSEADAVVLPYLRSSASGPLHMAMSYGRPVIVTSVGGLTEAAADYTGALFVDPKSPEQIKNRLLELLTWPRRDHVDPHSWQRSALLLEAVFRGLDPSPELESTLTGQALGPAA
jgi:glycosyltransferase involved in cell wall biosynthesis